MRQIILVLTLCLSTLSLVGQAGQSPTSTSEEFEKRYNLNIKKSRINNVYIPKDDDDAIAALQKLTTPGALAKFKSGEEKVVAEKLLGGLGQWMIINWNFYEGSRLSHFIKNKGLSYPEDMATYLIIKLHRNLNGVDENESELIAALSEKRRRFNQSKMEILESIDD